MVSGQIAQASVGDTRTEIDYLNHVQQLVASDPKTVKWHLLMAAKINSERFCVVSAIHQIVKNCKVLLV